MTETAQDSNNEIKNNLPRIGGQISLGTYAEDGGEETGTVVALISLAVGPALSALAVIDLGNDWGYVSGWIWSDKAFRPDMHYYETVEEALAAMPEWWVKVARAE